MFKIQHIETGSWLESPIKFSDGDEVWPFGSKEHDAHHFASRKEAKDTWRRIDPNGLGVIKLHKVK